MSNIAKAWLSLDGLSIGDAFGQCFFESENAQNMGQGSLPSGPWYFTDDTEMSLSVVYVLATFGEIQQQALAQSFATRYSYDRAYGPSMHRVLERIRHGEPWQEVTRTSFNGQGSWGNGAAMRAAPIGAFFSHDLARVSEQAARAAEVTHSHAEGIAGAIAVAIAAAVATNAAVTGVRPSAKEFLSAVIALLPISEVRSKLVRAQAIAAPHSVAFAVSILGNGSEMSAQDTVPFALWCCGQHLDNYSDALWLAMRAGGDRDTIGAIVGGVVAAFVGEDGIPASWRNRREPLPAWYQEA